MSAPQDGGNANTMQDEAPAPPKRQMTDEERRKEDQNQQAQAQQDAASKVTRVGVANSDYDSVAGLGVVPAAK